jgi:RNA polymerase sigma factor (sigma-70 family)
MTQTITQQQSLILESLDYARMLARRFHADRKHCGFSLEDYESAAFLGLCDAARRYTPNSEVAFSGFSFLRIQGEMNDLLRSSGYITKKQVRAIANLLGETGDSEALRKVLRALTLNLKHFQEIICDSGIRLHFDERDQVSDISYSNSISPEENLGEKLLAQYLRGLIAQLPEKERLVVELKYFEELTFEQMRRQFNGATRSWLCRIHSKAIDRLRALILASESACQNAQQVKLAEAA